MADLIKDGKKIIALAQGGIEFYPANEYSKYMKYFGKKIHTGQGYIFWNYSTDDGQLQAVANFMGWSGNVIGLFFASKFQAGHFDLDMNPNPNGNGYIFSNGRWNFSDAGQNKWFYILDATGQVNEDPSWSETSGLGNDMWEGSTDYPVLIDTSIISDVNLGDFSK